MAGFLHKNKRFIDYQLTEFGREKISEGSLDLKYYTFSDSSIVYNENLDSSKSFKVSSLKDFLPFEVDTNVSNIINPEYTLSSMLTFDDLDNNILFKNKDANKTISDYLIDLKLIDNKNLVLKNDDREIKFDYELERELFDFQSSSQTYSTVKSGLINARNIEYISKDRRFANKTRNKYLPPKNTFLNIDSEEIDPLSSNKLEVIFKSLKTEQQIPEFTTRNDFIVKIVKILRNAEGVMKLDYVLNEEKMIDEDVFLFELHKIIDDPNIVGEDDTLQKLSFVDIGEFYDEEEYNFKRIFLIGKFLLTRNIKDEINPENLRKRFEINNDYSFVNMFTLVVE